MTPTSGCASEALIGRIGDTAAKLVQRAGADLPDDVPWKKVMAARILVDRVYHRIDYGRIWETLVHDVPVLARVVREWAAERGVLHEAVATDDDARDTRS